MFAASHAFSGISWDRIDECRISYRDVLGLEVADTMGGLGLAFPGGGRVFIYPKENHEPATFTVLNVPVPDIDAAVDPLRGQGVETKMYPDDEFPTDEEGIARGGPEWGPDIAWFRDPAGNVISVLAADPANA
ncbi:MAG: glyoxalase [Naasia sp.]|nr:glyoxalase [Naasia sp.]